MSTIETFEGSPASWAVNLDVSGSGTAGQSGLQAVEGVASARLSTSASGDRAQVRVNWTDAASAHSWQERPGTWFWQKASVFVPSTTVARLGAGEYFTIGGLWPSNPNTYGWFLRVRQGGALYVVGFRDSDNARIEFPVYGTVPQGRWFDLELGLHTQAGPGVKRAFAFLIDGDFYGWYHQGRMKSETYDRAAIGVLDTNARGPLEVFVDSWSAPGTGPLPTGPDRRSTVKLQQQDYRTQSGVQWQIDWTTWSNSLRLDSRFGLYSETDRLQSGRNLDRQPDVSDGWAEIEIDWPRGTPPLQPTSYFGPMVGFRKEINREQNLEVIPIGRGGGSVDLVLEAWDGNGPVPLGTWAMPRNASGQSAIPEPGDIIRAKWRQASATTLDVRASFFDASSGVWYEDVIAGVYNLSSVNGINFFDGHHRASSVTIDTQYYSIRRYTVGTLDTAPSTGSCTATLDPSAQSVGAGGESHATTVTAPAGCTWTGVSNASWIAVTRGATGAGIGTLEYSVDPNTSVSQRVGTISIAGQTLRITQAGIECTYSASPGSFSVDWHGGGQTTNVTAPSGCGWTAASNASWISITSGASGSGSGPVGFAVASNPASSGRMGSLTVAAQTLNVTQGPSSCSYAVTRPSSPFPAVGASATINITAGSGCGWTASSNAGWITVAAPASGSGNGAVNYSVASNPNGTSRAGTLTVAGESITVNQSGVGCTYSISPSPIRLASSGGSGTISVTGASGCSWTAVSNASWLSVTSGASGSGNGTVTLQAAANTTGAERSGTLTIAGLTATVIEAAAAAGPTPLQLQISAGADDVNEDSSTFSASNASVWVGTGSSTTSSYAGFRFTGVPIPAGATITSARLELYSSQSQWISMSFSMAAHLSGNSAPFSATSKPSQRSLSTSKVTHTSNSNWSANTWYSLDDIKTVVQEIVGRSDWQSGHSLSLILKGSGSASARKHVRGYESGSTTAARLAVTYSVAAVTLPTVSLSVSPGSVTAGDSAVLTWTTANASTIAIDQGIGSVPSSGSLTVTPTTGTTYTLTATNSAGTSRSTATVTVNLPPPTVTSAASPPAIQQGQSSVLSWSSSNATSVSISNGIGTVPATGSVTVTPSTTTTYTVTATNATASVTSFTTVTVSAPTPAPSPGSSLRFNGSNQRSRFTTLPSMTTFTVETWVKRTADAGRYETFLSNASSGYNQETFGLFVDGGRADCGGAGDQFAWAYTKVGGGWFVQCSGVTADLNVWHHVAVTRDASNVTRMFIDGVLRGTVTGTAAPTGSSGALGIGGAGDAATEFFAGVLDEVRISSAVRYTATFAPSTSRFASDASTVALYHFDEGSGQTLADSSGNNRNGVLGTSLSQEALDPLWSVDSPVP